MIIGCTRRVTKHGKYRIQRCGGHQHNISNFVCCDCFMLLNLTLQTHVILVCGAFGGSICHWWSGGANHYLMSWLLISFIVVSSNARLLKATVSNYLYHKCVCG